MLKRANPRSLSGFLKRSISSTTPRLSQVDPSNPEEAHLYKVKPIGALFREPLDTERWTLSQEPLYEGPLASQVAFSKRWSLGFGLVGAYVGHLVTGVADVSTPMVLTGAAALMLPLPLIHWYCGAYVTRIFRMYRRGEPQTLENLERDETLLVEKLGVFGRSTYGVITPLRNTHVVNERQGWVNWECVDPRTGRASRMYVAENLGGIRMDRIWALVEHNSGVDNGRQWPIPYNRDESASTASSAETDPSNQSRYSEKPHQGR